MHLNLNNPLLNDIIEIAGLDVKRQELTLINEINKTITAIASSDLNGILSGLCNINLSLSVLESLFDDGNSSPRYLDYHNVIDCMGNFSIYRDKFNPTINEFFPEELLEKAFEIVCGSHFSKFDYSLEDAMKTEEHYLDKGVTCIATEISGVWVTKATGPTNSSDFPCGEILNSKVNYSSPCFAKLLKDIEL